MRALQCSGPLGIWMLRTEYVSSQLLRIHIWITAAGLLANRQQQPTNCSVGPTTAPFEWQRGHSSPGTCLFEWASHNGPAVKLRCARVVSLRGLAGPLRPDRTLYVLVDASAGTVTLAGPPGVSASDDPRDGEGVVAWISRIAGAR